MSQIIEEKASGDQPFWLSVKSRWDIVSVKSVRNPAHDFSECFVITMVSKNSINTLVAL